MNDMLGMDIDPELTTLRDFLTNFQNKDKDEIIRSLELISEKASKEFGLEKMLKKMQGEWSGMTLDLQSWKNSNVQIL